MNGKGGYRTCAKDIDILHFRLLAEYTILIDMYVTLSPIDYCELENGRILLYS
jgi:hypothetical protein